VNCRSADIDEASFNRGFLGAAGPRRRSGRRPGLLPSLSASTIVYKGWSCRALTSSTRIWPTAAGGLGRGVPPALLDHTLPSAPGIVSAAGPQR